MGLSEDYPQHYAEWWATGGNQYSEIPFELHLADLNIRPISDKRRWELLYYIARDCWQKQLTICALSPLA